MSYAAAMPQVRTSDGEVVDSVVLYDDFVHLHQNSGISLCGDLLSVLAVSGFAGHDALSLPTCTRTAA